MNDGDQWGIEAENKVNSLTFALTYTTSENPHLKQASLVYAALIDALGPDAFGDSSDTFLFAGLVNSLNQPSLSQDNATACIFLLSHVIPKVSVTVLQAKLETLVSTFTTLLRDFPDINFLTKNTIVCISTILRKIDHNILASKTGLKLLQTVLVFSVDPRPKIRQESKKAVKDVFRHMFYRQKSTWGSNATHPIPKPLWELICRFTSYEVSQCNKQDLTVALYLCNVLQSIYHYLPLTPIAECLTNFFNLSTELKSSNTLLTYQIFKSVKTLFNSGFAISRSLLKGKPFFGVELSPSELDQRVQREATFVEQLMESIINLQPKITDKEGVPLYCVALKTGLQCLHRLVPSRAHGLLNKTIAILTKFMESEDQKILSSAASSIRAIIRSVVDKDMVSAGLTSLQNNSTDTHIFETMKHITQLFQAKYRFTWVTSLTIIETLFATSPKNAAQLYIPLFHFLDTFYNSSENTQLYEAVERCIGAAIGNFGVEAVLNILPLNLPVHNPSVSVSKQLAASRSWMLPLLRINVKYSTLSYFHKELLPKHDVMLQLSALALSEGRHSEGRNLITLCEQIWDAFPSFCNLPSDCFESYKALSKKLSGYITNEDTSFALLPICRGINVLISSNYSIQHDYWATNGSSYKIKFDQDDDEGEISIKSTAPSFTAFLEKKQAETKETNDDDEENDDEDEEAATESQVKPPITKEQATANLKHIGQFSRNYLPLFFNAISEIQPQYRNIILDAILAYTTISDDKVKSSLFKTVVERYINITQAYGENARLTAEEAANIVDTARALTDILIAMAPSLDNDCLIVLYKAVKPYISCDNNTIQKKAYQLFPLVILSNLEFFGSIWEDALDALIEASGKVHPSVVGRRMKACTLIYCNIPNTLTHSKVIETLPILLGEAIVSSKEISSISREYAHQFVMKLAHSIYDYSISTNNPQFMNEYIYMILAGLASPSSHMKSGSITMLARVIYEFRYSNLPQDTISEILEAIILLLPSPGRDIINACLGFIKVTLLSLDKTYLLPQLPHLVKAVTDWDTDKKRRYKGRVRIIFTILMKKFGIEVVKQMVPQTDIRLIEHIRKSQERDERLKKEKAKNKKDSNNNNTMVEDTEDTDLLNIDRRGSGKSFDEIINEDSDDEDNSAAGVLSRALKASGKDLGSSTAFNKKHQETGNIWISESADFLDENVAQHIRIVRQDEQRKKKSNQINLTKSGKLDISGATAMLDESEKISLGIKPSEEEILLKRKRAAIGADIDDHVNIAEKAELEKSAKKRKDGIYDAKKARTENFGRAFASTKGAGDAIRRGAKHDPYAYVPLDPRSLNKRKNKLDGTAFEGAFNKPTMKHGQKASRTHRRAELKKKSGN